MKGSDAIQTYFHCSVKKLISVVSGFKSGIGNHSPDLRPDYL